jgi:hypothetical protein
LSALCYKIMRRRERARNLCRGCDEHTLMERVLRADIVTLKQFSWDLSGFFYRPRRIRTPAAIASTAIPVATEPETLVFMSGNRPVRISHSANKIIPKLLPLRLLVMLITYLLESVGIALYLRPTELALLELSELGSAHCMRAWMERPM